MSTFFLFSAAFLACVVEMVEALTIILATGITRGWRSTIIGASLAVTLLAVIIVLFGATTATLIPIDLLRLVVGGFLLIFGLQWLRKAILRASGLKALHDEELIFSKQVSTLGQVSPSGQGVIDWVGFTVAFKGVFLEGLEVVFIVVTFGASSSAGAGTEGVMVASAGALAAFVLVAVVGLLVHRPLAQVPENTMKFAVGLMLAAFGTFWAGEGAGVEWPLADATILVLLAVYSVFAFAAVALLKRSAQRALATA